MEGHNRLIILPINFSLQLFPALLSLFSPLCSLDRHQEQWAKIQRLEKSLSPFQVLNPAEGQCLSKTLSKEGLAAAQDGIIYQIILKEIK